MHTSWWTRSRPSRPPFRPRDSVLVHLEQEDYNKSTALEIAAGGRLYNVVVENEMVGKDLLQHGRLKKRVTIIPLNKINAHRMAPQVCIPELQAAEVL